VILIKLIGDDRVSKAARILVVDDEVTLALALEEALNMQPNYLAQSVNSAEEALDVLQALSFDLMITDIKMPGMDGLALLENVKARYPDMEVIVMTAFASIDTAVTALKKGAYDYLQKPLPNLNDFLEHVRRALEHRVLSLQNRQMREISKELTASLDLDHILTIILDKLIQITPATGAALFLRTRRNQQKFTLQAAYNSHADAEAQIRDVVLPYVLQNQQLLQICAATPSPLPVRLPYTAFVAVPLLFMQKTIGVLTLHSTAETCTFSNDDLVMIQTHADQAAIAVENAQLYKEALDQAGKLSIINAVSKSVNGMFDPEQILQAIIAQINWIVECTACGIYALKFSSPETWEISAHAARGYPESLQIPLDPVFARWLVKKRRPFLVADAHTDAELFPFFKDSPTRSLLAMPLESKDKLLALFILEDHEPGMFNEEDFGNVQLLANQISIALENAILFEEIQTEKGKVEAILQSTSDLIMVTDHRGNITIINPAAEQAFGVSAAHVHNRYVGDAIPNPKLKKLFEVAIERDAPLTGEISLQENGDEVTYYASLSPVKGLLEETIGRVAVMQDITHFKIMDQQKSQEIRRQKMEKEKVTEILRSYVSHEVAREILENPEKLTLGGARRMITTLFADLRSFTAFSERVPAETVVSLLNDFFTEMTHIIIEQRGTIDKFIGDCIMAIFGAPVSYEDDIERALRTALEMRTRFQNLRNTWKEKLGLPGFVDIAIGINTGEVVVGNVGSARKMDYTVIGDGVNFAARLEELAKPRQILISESTYLPLAERLIVEPLPPQIIRGKEGKFNIYQLVDFKE